jgi:two-component system, LuxR family, sensor kinase FixL
VEVPTNELSAQETPFGRFVEFCLHADRKRVLALSLAMTVAIGFADWRISLDVSLGILYLLPMMLAATVLPPPGMAVMAAVCAFLRWAFNPHPLVAESLLRIAFAFIAYLGSGLFVMALIRNRRMIADHLQAIKQEQAQRREAEEQLRVLVESSPAGILTLDGQGVVLAANKASDTLFASALRGKPIRDYLPVLADALQLDTGTDDFHTAAQCQGRRHTGEIFLAHTWFSTYASSEGPRLAAIVVDASEEMRDREEQNLRQLSRHSRITAAAVSHEIRNFCGAISLLYSNLRDKSPATHDDYQGLGSLVKGLERIASLELHSRVQEVPEHTPLKEVLDDLRIIIEPDWRDIDGVVRWNFPDQMPTVLADPHGLLQAFLNLAQNSLRAVEDCPTREFRISVSAAKDRVCVYFRDTGPGVAEPLGLFQPFQEGAEVNGIGLYVSRAILRSYGGELRYQSEVAGACFAVELQLSEEPLP